MNEVIQTLLNHRSIRKFEEKPLTEEQISTIIQSAQAASTSSFVQAYTIIGVTDEQKKIKLAELSGNQPYVAKNGHLLVFCADLYRHELIGKKEGVDFSETLDTTEKFTVSIIDAALAAQNAAIAAESLGLGICYIGGLRNELFEVSELLNTPERVFPLFGLVVGYPAENPEQKPRLPFTAIYHENEYDSDAHKIYANIESYDEEIKNYYKERSINTRLDTWSKLIVRKMANPARKYLKKFLSEKKFPLK